MNVIHTDNLTDSPAVLACLCTDVLNIASFGDHTQLLSVGTKAICDPQPGKYGTSDTIGIITISNIRAPRFNAGVKVAKYTTVSTPKGQPPLRDMHNGTFNDNNM